MPRHLLLHQLTITRKPVGLICKILFSSLPSWASGLEQEPKTSLKNVSLGVASGSLNSDIWLKGAEDAYQVPISLQWPLSKWRSLSSSIFFTKVCDPFWGGKRHINVFYFIDWQSVSVKSCKSTFMNEIMPRDFTVRTEMTSHRRKRFYNIAGAHKSTLVTGCGINRTDMESRGTARW